MKVRLLDGAAPTSNVGGWLKPNIDYVVLAIECLGGAPSYRIAAANGTPALFEPSLFEIVDASVDPDWIVRHSDGGSTELIPARWSEPGFWESFFDGEEHAVVLYKEVLRQMEGTPSP